MTLSAKERHWLEVVSAACREAALDSGWGTPADREWIVAYVNERRRTLGIRPLDPEDDDYPSELGFYERARALGMLSRGSGNA